VLLLNKQANNNKQQQQQQRTHSLLNPVKIRSFFSAELNEIRLIIFLIPEICEAILKSNKFVLYLAYAQAVVQFCVRYKQISDKVSIPLTNTTKPVPALDSEPIPFSTQPQNKTYFHAIHFHIIR